MRNDIPVRIIEKHGEHQIGSRGFGIQVCLYLLSLDVKRNLCLPQPRTYELFQILGILGDVSKHDTPIPTFRAYKPGTNEVAKEWTLYLDRKSWPDRPFVRTLTIYPAIENQQLTALKTNGRCLQQETLVRIFAAQLERHGVKVELSTGLVDLEQKEDRVIATTAIFQDSLLTGNTELIECQYLVGADGAKGATRKLLNLSFAGENRDADGAVWGDVEIDGLDNGWWHAYGRPGEWSMIMRPNQIGQGNLFDVGITGQNFDPVDFGKPEAAEKFIREHTSWPKLAFGKWHWLLYHKPNMRMVETFRAVRVFGIGNASHVHSYSGGQGVNSGIMDAANLAWKLALVMKSLADSSLLDSLNHERIPVISQMLAATTQLYTHLISHLKPKESADVAADAEDDTRSGWMRWRNDALGFFGVNCRYSDIVLDEHTRTPLDQDDALARSYVGYEGTRTLRAGDRAPGASGLILGSKETTLFELFSTHRHTLLIFAPRGWQDYARQFRDAAQHYPQGVVQTFVVTRESGTPHEKAIVLEDRDGSAHSSCLVGEDEAVTAVVRPDLFVGALVEDVEGLHICFGKTLKT
ncbi:uncharacterized protein PHACADRAFT_209358 [Phanerochaete carnosa HHB-10118-sp]|uniref:FAD-binding domain-containing protein n=1 Tax=Phanerochaete carnosa (strain HHB-10118-sp) TaxID=650164 RepID=K5VWC5_PHACS|nr:uncharacterized protein PHACADRAFT_209358 [Phanerochaete carnosa HHB-10118-sp]EKM55838.1 hypothetical protein PHACADRAFT_209358 [Phanerochaete carnosa HHB-10118-sp]